MGAQLEGHNRNTPCHGLPRSGLVLSGPQDELPFSLALTSGIGSW